MRRFLVAFAMLVAAAPAHAGPREERREVLATVQRLFDGMAARDQAALMAIVIPEGRITSHRLRDGNVVVRTGSWSDWAAGIAGQNERLEERMYNPRVRIRGSLATVWTEYAFYRNGAFSHCGIDHFDLVRIEGRWRVLNLTWTRQTERCPGR